MITQAQRDAYRYALEDKGVPEVIAFMAAKNLDSPIIPCSNHDKYSAEALICRGFFWRETAEGLDFWNSVYLCCESYCHD